MENKGRREMRVEIVECHSTPFFFLFLLSFILH